MGSALSPEHTSPTEPVPTAFVAGSTGYTGREVVRLSCARGVRTIAHVRPDSSRLDAWRQRFEQLGAEVDCSVWSDEAIAEALGAAKPTHVFGLLGTTRARARAERKATGSEISYETVDYALTAMLLRAAAGIAPKPRFIYLSAVNASRGSPSSYGHARWKVEQELVAGELPYTIARPSFITGPDRDDRRAFEHLGARALDGPLWLAGALGARRFADRWRSTSNTELATALVRLAFDAGAAHAIFHSDALR